MALRRASAERAITVERIPAHGIARGEDASTAREGREGGGVGGGEIARAPRRGFPPLTDLW